MAHEKHIVNAAGCSDSLSDALSGLLIMVMASQPDYNGLPIQSCCTWTSTLPEHLGPQHMNQMSTIPGGRILT